MSTFGSDFATRFAGCFFVISHHGARPAAELVHGWVSVVEHFMLRLEDAPLSIAYGPTEDRLLAAAWTRSEAGEPFHAHGYFEGERFVITALPRNSVPFNAGDWFWEQDDTESAEDTANGILHAKGPLELVSVVGAVQTRPRWGFIAPEKGTDGGLIARWYDSEREGMEALERIHADQEVDDDEAADERARADQDAVEGELEVEELPKQASAPAKSIAAELPPLSTRQFALAREALGFPNTAKRSYRNKYVANVGSDEADEWEDMVSAGYATQPVDSHRTVGFALTRAGAERALKPGETLNPTDFPPIGAH